MNKTALVVIATGSRYWPFIRPLVESARRFFVPHNVLLFTDRRDNYEVAKTHLKNGLGFPDETLRRYHTMLAEREWLAAHDYIFYVDVDMLMVGPVGEEIFSEGITSTRHPGYCNKAQGTGTYERNPRSTAYIAGGGDYFCGGFNGGRAAEFLRMAEVISANVDCDARHGIRAVWNDESHLNRYLRDHPPAKILSPSYCYPERANDYYKAGIWGCDFEQKILALTKG